MSGAKICCIAASTVLLLASVGCSIAVNVINNDLIHTEALFQAADVDNILQQQALINHMAELTQSKSTLLISGILLGISAILFGAIGKAL